MSLETHTILPLQVLRRPCRVFLIRGHWTVLAEEWALTRLGIGNERQEGSPAWNKREFAFCNLPKTSKMAWFLLCILIYSEFYFIFCGRVSFFLLWIASRGKKNRSGWWFPCCCNKWPVHTLWSMQVGSGVCISGLPQFPRAWGLIWVVTVGSMERVLKAAPCGKIQYPHQFLNGIKKVLNMLIINTILNQGSQQTRDEDRFAHFDILWFLAISHIPANPGLQGTSQFTQTIILKGTILYNSIGMVRRHVNPITKFEPFIHFIFINVHHSILYTY